MVASGVEGALQLALQWRDGCVHQVDIRSTRPLQMPNIFIGKQPAEVCSMLPLLYSVCGLAQGSAAVQAFEQALAIPTPPRQQRLRQALIAFETIREHLWRIELDWARFLELDPVREHLARAMALTARFRTTLFADSDPFAPGSLTTAGKTGEILAVLDDLAGILSEAVFMRAPAVWLGEMEQGGFDAWLHCCTRPASALLQRLQRQDEAALGAGALAAMGSLKAAELNRRLAMPDAAEFVAHPSWQEHTLETTAYSRQSSHPLIESLRETYGNGLLPRLAARVVEMARLCVALRNRVDDPDSQLFDRELPVCTGVGADTGLAQVEAARGRLIHRVVLEEGRVASYQIVAPTEWNFHPQGVLVQSLMGMEAVSESQLRWRAELLINAIDPCVGYQLSINGAAS